MTLVPVGQDFQFVQSSTPSGGQSGDWWLDTSTNPPVAKVYDGGSWVEVRTVNRVGDNLDAKVSNAGATTSDIESGAEGALEEDIANLSPASNSVAANLDGGVAAVDWASKTPKFVEGLSNEGEIFSISGSGYMIGLNYVDNVGDKIETLQLRLDVDGSTVFSPSSTPKAIYYNSSDFNTHGYISLLYRFDSGFTVINDKDSDYLRVSVNYVLD